MTKRDRLAEAAKRRQVDEQAKALEREIDEAVSPPEIRTGVPGQAARPFGSTGRPHQTGQVHRR